MKKAILTLAGAAVLATTAGCSSDPTVAGPGTVVPDVPVARRATFQERFLLTGELRAVHSDKIPVPRTPSWQVPIRWIEEDGATVVAGQKVAELDNSQFTGDLTQKRLAEEQAAFALLRKEAEIAVTLSQAEFDVERRRIEFEKARIEAAVPAELRPLREHQEKQLALIRAEVERDKAVETLETTRRRVAEELAQLRLAQDKARDEIRTAERAIAELTLLAPREGLFVVGEDRRQGRKLQVGDQVWVGMAVGSIPDLSAVEVEARLSDVDDGRIVPGLRAECVVDAYPGRRHLGTITEVTPVAQEENARSLRRFFRVTIRLDAADPDTMRPGMSVRAEVLGAPIEDALVVPRRSLELAPDPPRARLADGSRVEVRLGPCGPHVCVIEDGLDEGARLGLAG